MGNRSIGTLALLARENLKWKSQDSSLLVKGHYCTDVIFDWTTIYWDLEVSYVEDAKCENFCSLAPHACYNSWNFLKFLVFWSRSYECCKHEDIIVPRKYVFENKILRSWRIVCLRRKNSKISGRSLRSLVIFYKFLTRLFFWSNWNHECCNTPDIIVTKYGIDHAIDIEISKNSVFKKKKWKILLARNSNI